MVTSRPESSAASRTDSANALARLSRMLRANSAGLCGYDQAVTLAVRRDPGRHVAGLKERRVVGVEHGDGRVDGGGSVEQGCQVDRCRRRSAMPSPIR